jgi:hypothetical protein
MPRSTATSRISVCFLVLATFAASAHAQDGVDNDQVPILRFDAGFHLGVLGRVQGEVPLIFGSDRTLSPSPGVYFRADVALGRYFMFRPSLQWRSVTAEGIGGPHDLFSVQLGVGVHYEFDFRRDDSVTVEPYLFLMAGIDAVDRALIATEVFDEGTSFGPSWGVRLGLVTWVSSRIGISAAWGFERSDFFPSNLGEDRRHVYLTQMAIDVGVMFRLD